MSLELKKITWTKMNAENHFYHSKKSYRKGMVSVSGEFYGLKNPIICSIQNFITKYNKIYFDPNVFYLYFDNKKIKNTFTSIDQAKEFAQKSLEKFIIKTLFEPPPRRKVIVEKCKFQESKNKPKQKKKNPNTEFIPKAEVINLSNTSHKDKKSALWHYLESVQSIIFTQQMINDEQYPF